MTEGLDWGPIAGWAGAIATLAATLVALLASFKVFDRLRVPHLRVTFEQTEPWCRLSGHNDDGTDTLWVRVGVENSGAHPARGCVGRLTGLTTSGSPRQDIDPVQLRWAGVPRSRAFSAIDIRPGQREFLNVLLLLQSPARWRIVTFEDPDFDPGFTTELSSNEEHVLWIAVFADNASASTISLAAGGAREGNSMIVRILES